VKKTTATETTVESIFRTEEETARFMNSEIYRNWERYHGKYKKSLSEDDILTIKRQVESINRELESLPRYKGGCGPLYIIEKLYTIQKRIAKNNETILFEL
jgi:hypothetical protein